jgi:Tol biopolymer transport system component
MNPALLIPVAALGAALFAAGCGGEAVSVAENAAGATQGDLPAGRIAFRRYFDDAQTHGAVFTINPDGTGEKQLTRPADRVVDDQPDWSPDGRLVAFERCPAGKPCSVWTVRADGTHPDKVPVRCELKPICDANSPSWTPDGRLVVGLAQGRERERGALVQIQRFSIELVDTKYRNQQTIIARTRWTGDTAEPAVSPDGRTVVYKRWNSWRTRPVDGKALYAVGIDGAHNHQLTPWKLGAGDHPGFSPDGSKILFRSFAQEDAKQSNFWTVGPDGADLKQLTHVVRRTRVLSASYSADGTWIVHARDGVDKQPDIVVMRADGTGAVPVTRTTAWDSAPDWGPPAAPAP